MKDNIIGVAFKTGIIVESKIGFAKVKFPDLDDMVTAWLPINYAFTLGKREAYALNKNMLVNCIMDAYLEGGCIIGAAYSDEDAPPTNDPAVYVMDMGDGSSITFDGHGNPTLKGKTVTLDAAQTVCTGSLKVNGDIKSDGSIMDTTGNSNHHVH